MENLSLVISYNSIKDIVRRNISAIGKRRTDNRGNTMFASSTLSSAEEALMEQYTSEGLSVFLGEMSPIVTGGRNGGSVNVTFNSTRVNEAKKKAFEDGMVSFISDYVRMRVLELGEDDYSVKKAGEDLQRTLNAAVRLMFTPGPPASSGKTLADMHGEVILD